MPTRRKNLNQSMSPMRLDWISQQIPHKVRSIRSITFSRWHHIMRPFMHTTIWTKTIKWVFASDFLPISNWWNQFYLQLIHFCLFNLRLQVKVTEIFDMTDSDSPVMQTFGECETNQQLQYDSEWDVVPPTGSNCHGCLKLDWESSTSRCVRHI